MSRIDAEAAVIGACLIDRQAYWRIADLIAGEDFQSDDHRALWETIRDLSRAGTEPDFVIVGERLPRLAKMAVELASASPGAANVRGYAEWVLQAAVERRIQSAGQRIAKLRGPDVVGEAQRIVGACAPRNAGTIRPVRDFLRESVARMQERCDADDALTGVPSGIADLDELTAGWQRGDLVIIAARPSVGKTAFALQCALHAAEVGHPVLFMSLEMTGSQLADRALSNLGRVSSVSIRAPKRLDDAEWMRVNSAGARLNDLPLLIDESSSLTVDALCARVRQCDASKRLGLVVIDYLTQITPPRAESITEGIQTITRQLKALAKEIQVPIMLLSQLNRDGENRPTLSSLRSSGAIEQDADVVALLHRPNASEREKIEFILAKQRNGPCGELYFHADMDAMRFTPGEKPSMPEPNATGFRKYGRGAAA